MPILFFTHTHTHTFFKNYLWQKQHVCSVARTGIMLLGALKHADACIMPCIKRPHPAIGVSSYYYICVPILLYMCPHTAVYLASANCYIFVLILLYVCPDTAVH